MTMYYGSFRDQLGKAIDLDKFLNFFFEFDENHQLVNEVSEVEESEFMMNRFEEKINALYPLI